MEVEAYEWELIKQSLPPLSGVLVLVVQTSTLRLWRSKVERELPSEYPVPGGSSSARWFCPCQLAFLDINHTGNSYVNFPRVNYLFLNTKDTESGRILATGPVRHARRIYGHCVGNFPRFPKLVFWGNAHYYPVINLGWEVSKLRVTTLFLGASRPIRDGPI